MSLAAWLWLSSIFLTATWPSASTAAASGTAATPAASTATFADVIAGHPLSFPADFGSHPAFRTEWWYVTGWLTTVHGETLGFQVTFFRTRPGVQDDNPSAFAARQIIIAHSAISDPAHGRPWQDQRIARAGFGLVDAAQRTTDIHLDDWSLERAGAHYDAHIRANDFALELQLATTQPPLLNGEAGFSQKGPDRKSASYYYSEPHLAVSGTVTRAGTRVRVSGEAWLDHEWSSQYLDPQAVGWDWIGMNLADGGALMAFEIRDQQGHARWAGATLRAATGRVRYFEPNDIHFVPIRWWRSSRSGANYPIAWRLQLGEQAFTLQPLMDDQEIDARLSSGAIYWEGALSAFVDNHRVGSGYLELTGYDRPLSVGAGR